MHHYFLITFQYIIDGHLTDTGTTGATASTVDYKPNMVKAKITKDLRNSYPDAKSVAVAILMADEVTKEQYITAGYVAYF
jgi:hypothetical protein